MAVIEPVVNAKVKHINEMVLRQRSSKSKKGFIPKRLRGVQLPKQPLLPTPSYDEIELPPLIPKSSGPPPADYILEQHKLRNQYTQSKNKRLPPRFKKTQNDAYSPPKNDIRQVKSSSKFYNQSDNYSQPSCSKMWNKNDNHDTTNITSTSKANTRERDGTSSKTADSDDYLKSTDRDCNRRTFTNDDDELDFSDNSFDDLIYESDEDLDVETELSRLSLKRNEVKTTETILLPVEEYTSQRVSKRVKRNLQILIGEHPDGIWCSKLTQFYK